MANGPYFTPDNSGRGTWWTLHMTAAKKKHYFPELMRDIRDNFFCPEVCKPHIEEYMRKHPIPSHPDRWFDWSIDFHNDVNLRTGKPFMERSEARRLFGLESSTPLPQTTNNNTSRLGQNTSHGQNNTPYQGQNNLAFSGGPILPSVGKTHQIPSSGTKYTAYAPLARKGGR